MKLDKGSVWGVPEKEIEEAAKQQIYIEDDIYLKDSELINVLNNTGRNNPEIIELWVLLHMYACVSIVNFAETNTASIIDKEKVRLGLAHKAFTDWEKINPENINYIVPNTYYLSDYNRHFNDIYKKYERN